MKCWGVTVLALSAGACATTTSDPGSVRFGIGSDGNPVVDPVDRAGRRWALTGALEGSPHLASLPGVPVLAAGRRGAVAVGEEPDPADADAGLELVTSDGLVYSTAHDGAVTDDVVAAYLARVPAETPAEGREPAVRSPDRESDVDPVWLPNSATSAVSNGRFAPFLHLMAPALGGGTVLCTATLIGPRAAITAAHCLYDGGYFWDVGTSEVPLLCPGGISPGDDHVDDECGVIASWSVYAGYRDKASVQNDWALVFLRDDYVLPPSPPHLPVLDSVADEIPGDKVNLVGYEAHAESTVLAEQMGLTAGAVFGCRLHGLVGRTSQHNCSTEAGDSGAALYQFNIETDFRRLIGVHHGWVSTDSGTVNRAVLIAPYHQQILEMAGTYELFEL